MNGRSSIPEEHLILPWEGQLLRDFNLGLEFPWRRDVRWGERLAGLPVIPCAPLRVVYNAVPDATLIPEDGWLVSAR